MVYLSTLSVFACLILLASYEGVFYKRKYRLSFHLALNLSSVMAFSAIVPAISPSISAPFPGGWLHDWG